MTLAHEQGVPPRSPLYEECISTLCALGLQSGPRFITFDGLITRSIEGKGLNTQAYRQLSADLRNGVISEYRCDAFSARLGMYIVTMYTWSHMLTLRPIVYRQLPSFDTKRRYADTDVTGGAPSLDVDGLGNPRGSESDLVGIGNTTQNQWHLTRNEYSALSVGAILQNSPGHALAGNTGVPGLAGGMGSSNLAAAAAAQQAQQFGGGGAPKALPFNQQQLSRAWDVSQVPSCHRHILFLPPFHPVRPPPPFLPRSEARRRTGTSGCAASTSTS